MVDSTTVTVRDAPREEFPGAGAYAAIKVHIVLSVGYGTPVHDHFSPVREHDSRPLDTDAAWQGCGLLADLASTCLAWLCACTTPGVRVVILLKDSWQSKVDSIARGPVTQERFPGTTLDVLLEEESPHLDERTVDAGVRTGSLKHPLHLRCVGIHTPKGYGFCLTKRPPRIGSRQQVADLYQGRWEVDLSIRLDQIDAERPCSVKLLRLVALIASIIADLLAHTHDVRLRPPQKGTRRPEAPLHPPAYSLVACRLLSVDGAGRGSHRCCREAVLATDRGVAHA